MFRQHGFYRGRDYQELPWADNECIQCQWCQRNLHSDCVGIREGMISVTINWSRKASEDVSISIARRERKKHTVT